MTEISRHAVVGSGRDTALRTAVEHYAFHTDPAAAEDAGLLEATVNQALLAAARGLSP
jgi:hypothetical protein